MQNLMIFLLQLSMIAALLASFWVLRAIAVMIVESYGISGTAVALAIIYGVAGDHGKLVYDVCCNLQECLLGIDMQVRAGRSLV
jgi:hypothetical protein